MLKKAPNFVLGHSSPSTYTHQVRLGALASCGLVGWPFWASCGRI